LPTLTSLVDSAGLSQDGQTFWEQFEALTDDQKLQDRQNLAETDQDSLRNDGRVQSWWETNVG
jgi:hypothetical protein